jgi:hypothetical protein
VGREKEQDLIFISNQENKEEGRVWGSNDWINDAICKAGGRKQKQNDRNL